MRIWTWLLAVLSWWKWICRTICWTVVTCTMGKIQVSALQTNKSHRIQDNVVVTRAGLKGWHCWWIPHFLVKADLKIILYYVFSESSFVIVETLKERYQMILQKGKQTTILLVCHFSTKRVFEDSGEGFIDSTSSVNHRLCAIVSVFFFFVEVFLQEPFLGNFVLRK